MAVLESPAMNLREFLVEPIGYLAPGKALDGLDAGDAERRVPGVTHSVAEVVAHLAFWQDWFHARCEGRALPMVSSAAAGWPVVTGGAWPDVRGRFLDRLRELAALGDGDINRRLTPAIEFPPLAEYTIGDVLVHVATHNAHHLGQAIVLRQLIGAWPPPAGSWTW